LSAEPSISCLVLASAITHFVRDPVDFDAYLCGRTIEVNHIATDRMLAAKLHTYRFLAQLVP